MTFTRVPVQRNPKAVQLILTPDEMLRLFELACARQKPKENNHLVQDKRVMVRRSNEATHLIGLMGEYAVSKYLGAPLDTDVFLAGDSYKDFRINGVNIEVKTLQGLLVFNTVDDFRADVAVLAIWNKSKLEFSGMPSLHFSQRISLEGWITKRSFVRNQFMQDFGYGPRSCVQPAWLYTMTNLMDYCMTVAICLTNPNQFED
jgi:hypothetical protein